MKEVVFVTMDRARDGFRLTGIRQETVSVEQAEALLQKLFADADIGVIALEEPLAEAVGDARIKELTRRWPGVLVTLPAPGEVPPSEADALQRLVRQALGYHVRLDA